MLRNYVTVAIRNIARHKSFSLVNILCLALGMASVIVISLWVRSELSYDEFHQNADQLHRVAFTTEQHDFHSYYLPGTLAEFLKSEYPEIVNAASFRDLGEESKIAHGDRSFLKEGAFADSSFFSMFSFPLIAGDAGNVFAGPMSIVITESLARSIFQDEDPVGKVIKLEDMAEMAVTGVTQDIPSNSHIQFDFLIPFELAPPYMKRWDNKVVLTYVQLDENSSHEQVSQKIAGVYNDHNPGATKNFLYLQPITECRLHDLGAWSRGETQIVTYIYVLSAIALAILLIACINFMNLSTARWSGRAREIAIRKVVGSSRRQLAVQFLSESILLSLMALLLAAIMVEMLLPSINRILETHLSLNLSIDIVLWLLVLAVVTGVFAGSYPAFWISSYRPVIMLRRGRLSLPIVRRTAGGRSRLLTNSLSPQRLLVVCQLALSVILIIAVVVLGKQLDFVNKADIGYNRDEIVVLRMHGEMVRKSQALKDELLKNSNIKAVSLTLSKQISWSESCGIDWEGKQAGDEFDVGINRVDFDYLETFNMEMAAGRFYSPEFPSDISEGFVLNEAAVRAMGMTDPIGKVVSMPALRRSGPIVGVIKDFHSESLHKEVRPFALIPGDMFRFMNIRIDPANLEKTLATIKEEVKTIVVDDPFACSFLSDEIAALYRTERRTGELAKYMTLLALLISCIGLYGLASHLIERRTKEIAVRKALGASVSELVRLISREFVMLVMVACVAAWPIAYYLLNRWLEDFAYRISIGWGVLLLAAGVTLAVVISTVSIRSVRAATANPVDSLRHE